MKYIKQLIIIPITILLIIGFAYLACGRLAEGWSITTMLHLTYYGNYGWTSFILYWLVYTGIYMALGAFTVFLFAYPQDIRSLKPITTDGNELRIIFFLWPIIWITMLSHGTWQAIKWIYNLTIHAQTNY